MSATVFFTLLVAWGIIFVLQRAVKIATLRNGGRVTLASVGERAVTRMPRQASLTETKSPIWANQFAVEQQAVPLRNEGFKDLGVYTVSTFPGVFIRMMAHPQTYAAAHIYDHPKSGSWIEFVTRYANGSTCSLSTLPPTGMDHPEWFRRIQADKNAPTDQLYRKFIAQRERNGIKAVAPEDAIREFEENYAKLAAWRQERGITAKEVAHVAVKWLYKRQAAGTNS
ncbi:MAG: hypothetical protein WBV46_10770 [Terriglobales bacterium]|jgi:hypothetical protein